MKKLLLLSLLCTIGMNVSAGSNCSISYMSDDKLIDILKKNNFEFDNYQEVCECLKSANAKVNLRYTSAISNQQATAVVIAVVEDINFPIASDRYKRSIWSSPERTTAIEVKLLIGAVNDALNGIDQSDIKGLNENRKKMGVKIYPVSSNIK
ncbi:hypothetical protein [Acinetobacter sp. ANC 4178]|uniref:hypothetical protein n=1 Tax=Acinetobacter sp. ANC 4178 TaxID=2529839 RepID=UPI00103C9ECE|nr:hypothetical protein [Acinetobacter sp. ANC 4178]TCB65873.1 hypothetical protein E0H87_11675 [Acinetobacter sp. ANC 4178]